MLHCRLSWFGDLAGRKLMKQLKLKWRSLAVILYHLRKKLQLIV